MGIAAVTSWRRWLATLCVALAGCGSGVESDKRELVAVSGLVSLDGQPLAGATISFVPTGVTEGNGSFATTGGDGRYELTNADGRAGAVQGHYTVILTRQTMPDGSPIPAGAEPISVGAVESLPTQYTDPERSIPKYTVPAGGVQSADFVLKSKP